MAITVTQNRGIDTIVCTDGALYVTMVDGERRVRSKVFLQPFNNPSTIYNCQEFDEYFYELVPEGGTAQRFPATGTLTRENNHFFTLLSFTTNEYIELQDTRTAILPNITVNVGVDGETYNNAYHVTMEGKIVTEEAFYSIAKYEIEFIGKYDDLKNIKDNIKGFIWIASGDIMDYPPANKFLRVDAYNFDTFVAGEGVSGMDYLLKLSVTKVDKIENLKHIFKWNIGEVAIEFATIAEVANVFSSIQNLATNTR